MRQINFEFNPDPASLSGVFHVIRPQRATSKTRLSATQLIRGSLLIEGDVRATGRSIFSSDPDFEQGIAPCYTRAANFRGGSTRLLRTAASEDSGNCLQVTGRFSRRTADPHQQLPPGCLGR